MRNISLSLVVVCFGAPLSVWSQTETASASAPASVVTAKPTLLDDALRDEIVAMAVVDQNVRKNAGAGMSKSDIAAMKRVDDEHEIRMKEIIAQHGWPGKSLVGVEGSNKAWLIVQHCSPSFQEECLPLLERAVAAGEATPKNYAYLLDRVRMHQGKPQVYGTQFRNGELWKLEDPDHVDERRRSIGLDTMAEYTEQMKRLYKPVAPKINPSPSPSPNASKLP
jgi:hypothetical protein